LAPTSHQVRVATLAEAVMATVETARGDEAALITTVIPDAEALASSTFQVAVAGLVAASLAALHEAGFPHPVRMWTFIPGIHAPMGDGLDRYRVFNAGRYDGFARWLGRTTPTAASLPAASAVGHHCRGLTMCALGSRTQGVHVENPRQAPAFTYSPAYGPKPPCFSRGTVVSLPTGSRLLISGTASIRGEHTVHVGSLSAQLEETLGNIDLVTRNVPGPDRFAISGVETARVYFPRVADRAWLASAVAAALPAAAAIEFVHARVCRPELLVEIEATVAAS